MKCHQIGEHQAGERQGPTLFFRKEQMLFRQPAASSSTDPEAYITSERMRPEFLERWIAQPARLHGFSTPMLEIFDPRPNEIKEVHKRLFEGSQADRITALRDVLMNTPPVADLPGNRYYRYKIGEQKP